jgi:catechol 2,3-dioxygenase-like lactoylglutathione lyase family enzyme
LSEQQSLITRTDFVFLPITSFEKAEEFYSGVLGLPCSKRYNNEIGGEFETGSLTIQVVDVAKIGREFEPSNGAIALHVDDVEAARVTLEAGVSRSTARRWTAASATKPSSRTRTATR